MKATYDHWLVFGTGRRCRVSLWPRVNHADDPTRTTGSCRYIVFESPGELGCLPVPPSLDLDTLDAEDLYCLYNRARRLLPERS
jgi:hypothetical protein